MNSKLTELEMIDQAEYFPHTYETENKDESYSFLVYGKWREE